ncbi:MAG: hypothetical protein JNL80_03860 [Phycisphaerae bacterium]|nr:hypothetical protein [Phycisphaerae bacterium]
MRTRLKVCCIASPGEARVAIAAGADALGLVAAMPTGPGPIADGLIREIAAGVPAPVATFLLTSRDEPNAIVEHIRFTGASTVQLVDDTLGEDVWSAIRQASPATRIVQVIHVRDERSVDRALAAAEHVDTLLLDSGHPAKRELGGTDRMHDWNISRAIVERSKVPVFLAGGINASNVADAMRAVRPFGIDLCSGVRTNGALDAGKLRALVEAMRAVDRELSRTEDVPAATAESATWPPELDALLAAREHHTLLLENERVRVLDTLIRPGETVRLHTHQWPAAYYILEPGDFVRRDETGRVQMDSRAAMGSDKPAVVAGQAVWSAPLGPHTLENVGATSIRVVSVEVK